MMFCTTFLSAPSEDLHFEGNASGAGGGAAAVLVGGGGLSPGSCLSSLHCLVLPQDERYPSLSELTDPLPLAPAKRAHTAAGKMFLGVRLSACGARDGGGIWDRVRGRRSRSASPSPGKTPKSPCSERVKGPTLPMATIDIKNPEISNVQRFHKNSQMNNMVHSTFQKREKKGKPKKKRLTKADIGTPSNFQ
ncbi:Neural Wiskott-Aldrich syndrome protein [Liparis tanakae]|uniref:Neural Wiskott-Aldrich syndrome protein n=1 Tax=Liparis tanakae TaxID=230148 RepID=A0A4Z2E3J5_9TELE|nr:Neural Wiskott-Aldrich syndrome protein [Liparis tanakae]